MSKIHYKDVMVSVRASQITSLANAYSIIYSGADQNKHQSSTSLAFVRGIHRWPVNSPRKRPVTQKMFPIDDVIMCQVANHSKTPHASLYFGMLCISTVKMWNWKRHCSTCSLFSLQSIWVVCYLSRRPRHHLCDKTQNVYHVHWFTTPQTRSEDGSSLDYRYPHGSEEYVYIT